MKPASITIYSTAPRKGKTLLLTPEEFKRWFGYNADDPRPTTAPPKA